MATSSDTIVEFHGITKSYTKNFRPALKIEGLSIKRGEFFSILGSSGSGKTTALRLIAGFEAATSGSITLDGADVTHVPAHLRDVNTVFQSYALFPHMTVRENVAYPLKVRRNAGGDVSKLALEALSMVEMDGFEARFPHQLSGGQRQRVALARAFVGRPKIMLLDEPLSALDLNLRHQMQHMLVKLQRELGMTFVYVTHDQGEALSMSDRVAVLSQGELQQLGTPHDIYYAPQNQFVAQFIGKSNFLPVTVEGGAVGRTAALSGQSFAVRDSLSNGAARLCMRFEDISVLPAGRGSDRPIQLRGRIGDALFMGSTIEVSVDCGDNQIIAIMPSAGDFALTPGDEAIVGFDPARGHVFNV
jgi:spermidine/putrescine transport system ATP-binding protein